MDIYFDPMAGNTVPDGKMLEYVDQMFDVFNHDPKAYEQSWCKVGQELIILAIRAYCKRHKIEGVKVHTAGAICYIYPNGSIDYEFWDDRNTPSIFDKLLIELLDE